MKRLLTATTIALGLLTGVAHADALETLSAANANTQAAIVKDYCQVSDRTAKFSLSTGERTIYDLIIGQLEGEARGIVKLSGSKDYQGTFDFLNDQMCDGAIAFGLTAYSVKAQVPQDTDRQAEGSIK